MAKGPFFGGAKPINVDRARGSKMRNRIHRIGIELEGGWRTLPSGTRLTHDGSVSFVDSSDPPRNVGELPSPPLDMETWPKWLKQYFPQAVNATCGMHVHLSFQSALTYQRLMRAEYPATMIHYLSRWAKAEGLRDDHPIWPRLAGKSRFCQHIFAADQQVQKVEKEFNQERAGHRYTSVNYCFGRYATLEHRVLPMMQDAAQAERVIREIIDVTNAFLVTTAKREEKLRAEVLGGHDAIVERTRVVV